MRRFRMTKCIFNSLHWLIYFLFLSFFCVCFFFTHLFQFLVSIRLQRKRKFAFRSFIYSEVVRIYSALSPTYVNDALKSMYNKKERKAVWEKKNYIEMLFCFYLFLLFLWRFCFFLFFFSFHILQESCCGNI